MRDGPGSVFGGGGSYWGSVEGRRGGFGEVPKAIGGLATRHMPVQFCKHAARYLSIYPRACGENLVFFQLWLVVWGSSPRIRGKPAHSEQTRPETGLIPAHTGKTYRIATLNAQSRAHPRACGENWCCGWFGCEVWGSSPRIRGKPGERHRAAVAIGLIPAHTGNAASRWKG